MDRTRRDRPGPLDRWSRYRFRSVWDLDAPPELVFSVLEQPGAYPRWWPQVRRAETLDAHTGTALIRSVLPYGIHVTVTELRRDPARGVLEVALGGDLDGWARWTVGARRGAGATRATRALYEQEVVVRRAVMRLFALPARPLFRLNHALMMRAGRRGLAARLAARPEAV